MKKIHILVFFLLINCTTNKVYICGDHPCKNKKEIDEYFKNNISVEVYVLEKKKESIQNQNLVKLNLNQLKNEKEKKKELTFLNKRRLNKIEQSKQTNSKLKLKVEKQEPQNMSLNKKVNNQEKPKKIFSYKKNSSTKIVHLCKNLNECDIDIITKKVTDLGKGKSFPDINFK